ncbi:MAG: metallophosphoesterase [Endomicrobium sp.]|jgi:predicted phosphodiesterase|nr:metallophosphoesterase [Endomicrobium sp.]
MLAKILFVTDMHKRDIDFTSIGNYTKALDAVQQDLLSFIDNQKITHMISTGDWYDKGYRNVGRSHSDRNFDEEFNKVLNGNFYMCIGNHFFLERDANPEMYLIQPHDKYKPIKDIVAFTQVIKTPVTFKIGTVQISLFHYSKDNKEYKIQRDDDTTFHIGVYHDDVVVPSNVRALAGYFGNSDSLYLKSIYENIDLAIIGHIHVDVGVEHLTIGNKRVPLIIPGSMCITKNASRYLHTVVKLPVVEISDACNVTCNLFKFSTYAELLKFYNKREAVTVYEQETPIVKVESPKSLTLFDFLSAKDYTAERLELIKAVNQSEVNLFDCVKLLNKGI